MSGTVIELDGIEEDDGSTDITFRVKSDTGNLPGRGKVRLGVNCDEAVFTALARMRSAPGTNATAIRDSGLALFDALDRHKNAAPALGQTLRAAAIAANRSIRVFFPDFGEEVRNLPWEVLCDPHNGFFDTDNGIPIIRVVETASTLRPPPTLPSGELRVVAVLAAKHIDSRPEYEAILRALKRYHRPWRLKIFTPDRSVHHAVSTGGDARIDVQFTPGTAEELISDVADFGPQICHFLCHGLSVSGGRLLVANRATNGAGAPVELRPHHLRDMVSSSAWLVILNACSSGQSDPNSESASLATGLVHSGVPVVVGMRQETGMMTLNTFTRTFLGSALRRLDAGFAVGGPFELDLSASLSAARAALCGGTAPRDVKEWTLPAMTVCADRFAIHPPTVSVIDDPGAAPRPPTRGEAVAPDDHLLLAERIGERNTLRQFLLQVGDSLDDDARAAIEARLAELDERMPHALADRSTD